LTIINISVKYKIIKKQGGYIGAARIGKLTRYEDKIRNLKAKRDRITDSVVRARYDSIIVDREEKIAQLVGK